MINGISKLTLLILLFGFISISPKTRYMVGISLKQISSFLLWTVNIKIEKNGSQITEVGCLSKNLSHRIK